MDKVRIGMVGSKFAADFHADSHSRNPRAEIVAVAAIDNLEEYSGKWGIKETMTDYKELCKRPDIDIIDVCVPNFLHHQVVMEAASHGKHVFCEKPLAITVEEAREMVEFCKKQGVKLLYAEDWCFAPALLKAVDLIKQGAIGALREILEYTLPFLMVGGRLLAMKGRAPDAELRQLPEWVKLESVEKLSVPGLHEQRHLVIMSVRPEPI